MNYLGLFGDDDDDDEPEKEGDPGFKQNDFLKPISTPGVKYPGWEIFGVGNIR